MNTMLIRKLVLLFSPLQGALNMIEFLVLLWYDQDFYSVIRLYCKVANGQKKKNVVMTIVAPQCVGFWFFLE